MSFAGSLNERYFDGKLSPEVMALIGLVDDQRPEVHRFVDRMFSHMHRRRMGATEFSEGLAWVTGYFLQNILPGAWGTIPPITQRGRHSKIDDYLTKNPWRPMTDGDRLLDLGCGFPPVTTLDTADRYATLNIVGADPSFGAYLVREANGDYAVFSEAAELIYFQPGAMDADRWTAMYADPRETRRRFTAHLYDLRGLLPELAAGVASVSKDGVELVRNPLAGFERENVTFRQQGIGTAGLSGFAAARCFNVLMYFDDPFRRKALQWLAGTLTDGGISVTGANWSGSRWARYCVHRAEGGTMVAKEFAFSIENVRPLEIISFFALHDDDHDLALLTSLIGVLRGDDSFSRDIDSRMDELQNEVLMCPRKPNGYLGGRPEDLDPKRLMGYAEMIGSTLEREGFHERAVQVLQRSGFRSWINCVGHVAVDPASIRA
jgi:hypothetical protein